MQNQNQIITTEYVRLFINVSGADTVDDIKITLQALEAVEKIRKEKKVSKEYILRIGTKAEVNKGLGFTLTFDTDFEEGDRILKSDFFDLMIDSRTLFYAMGMTIDFSHENENEGFVFRWES